MPGYIFFTGLVMKISFHSKVGEYRYDKIEVSTTKECQEPTHHLGRTTFKPVITVS